MTLKRSAAGLIAVPNGDDDRARRFQPRTRETAEPRFAQRRQVRLHALDEAVAIQKAAARFEETVDRAIAGVDLFGVAQIVDRNRRHREIEGTADLLRP